MSFELESITSQQLNIQQLIAHSYEGGTLLVEAIIAGESGYVVDNHQRPVHFRSIQEIKDGFHSCDVSNAVLIYETAYDEMIGLSQEAQEPSQIPIQIN
ncbi:hypothetical protein C2869_18110 [Saccharobesus litoralis]|uniref:Na(+)-translocating NADH-quinone reductase subunit B n=1 Tax=Saccharobesus litoralis TaxID=2172099 RepID=A0A2S0VVH8_9ALTE|nr:DUF6482 family protein [Saccharobesus litoralis]AWB68208.1 hypothetical protein C2869_18110 [Saccharobesus litoralis]